MKEFDLRQYLAENKLLKEEEKDVTDKARREAEEEGYEDGYDDAIEDAKKALDGIKDESEEEKDKKKDVKEDARTDAEEEGYLDGEKDEKKKLTKEGLKSMIREKITSILNEESIKEAEEVNVEDDEEINVDIEKKVDVDKESEESDIEVKSELPGEDSETSAVLGLLTKAQEEAEGMEDEVLMDQIGNTITYFTRKHVVKTNESKEDLNEKLFGLLSDVEVGERLGVGTDRGGLGFTKLSRGKYKVLDPTSHPSFRQGQIWKPKQDEKKLYVGQSLPGLGDIESLRIGKESVDKVRT